MSICPSNLQFVHLFCCPSVWMFSWNRVSVVCFYEFFSKFLHDVRTLYEVARDLSFFLFLYMMIGIFKKWQRHLFQENLFLPKFQQKGPKMTPKYGLLDFLRNFVFSFSCKYSKMETIIFLYSTKLKIVWIKIATFFK